MSNPNSPELDVLAAHTQLSEELENSTPITFDDDEYDDDPDWDDDGDDDDDDDYVDDDEMDEPPF